ncbi:MAG: hypothetical protein ACYC8T_12475 [Myxococcaceae bacterium]
MPDDGVLGLLEADHLLTREGGAWRPTRRWQAAMARAASRLVREGVHDGDLRLPIASALVELRGELSDEELASRVAAILPIEEEALRRALGC